MSKRKFSCIFIILIFVSIAYFCCYEKGSAKIVTLVPQLHNGDAKFYNNSIITNVGGCLKIYDLKGNVIVSYDEINSSWIDAIPDEGIIVYGNFSNEIGILKIDKNYKVISNNIIMKSENLQIDPTITVINGKYYITVTEIVGNINNSNLDEENGYYKVHLYNSVDLINWEFLGDVVEARNNLEDIDIFSKDNKIYVVYEKEAIDKGNSSIWVTISDDTDIEFNESYELLPADCDHEPAGIEITNNGYRLYYSSDKKNPKESYMGGNIYYAEYDRAWKKLNKDKLIKTETAKGILLYDVNITDNKQQFLYARNYLTDCDMVVEERLN